MRSGGVAPHINRFNNRWNMSCQPRASERAPDRYSVGGCESPIPVWPLWRREISLLFGLCGPCSCLAALEKRNISSPWAVWALFLSGLFGEEKYLFSLSWVGPFPVWPLCRREISLLLGLCGPYSCLASLEKRNISFPWAGWALFLSGLFGEEKYLFSFGCVGPISCLASLEKRDISSPWAVWALFLSGLFGEEKYIFSMSSIELLFLDLSAHVPVTSPPALTRCIVLRFH